MRAWDIAHAFVGAMIFTAAMFLMLLILTGCTNGLPSRPPTGNHGQGHSPTAECPGQYKNPVFVNGIEFPLTCFGVRNDP